MNISQHLFVPRTKWILDKYYNSTGDLIQVPSTYSGKMGTFLYTDLPVLCNIGVIYTRLGDYGVSIFNGKYISSGEQSGISQQVLDGNGGIFYVSSGFESITTSVPSVVSGQVNGCFFVISSSSVPISLLNRFRSDVIEKELEEL